MVDGQRNSDIGTDVEVVLFSYTSTNQVAWPWEPGHQGAPTGATTPTGGRPRANCRGQMLRGPRPQARRAVSAVSVLSPSRHRPCTATLVAKHHRRLSDNALPFLHSSITHIAACAARRCACSRRALPARKAARQAGADRRLRRPTLNRRALFRRASRAPHKCCAARCCWRPSAAWCRDGRPAHVLRRVTVEVARRGRCAVACETAAPCVCASPSTGIYNFRWFTAKLQSVAHARTQAGMKLSWPHLGVSGHHPSREIPCPPFPTDEPRCYPPSMFGPWTCSALRPHGHGRCVRMFARTQAQDARTRMVHGSAQAQPSNDWGGVDRRRGGRGLQSSIPACVRAWPTNRRDLTVEHRNL